MELKNQKEEPTLTNGQRGGHLVFKNLMIVLLGVVSLFIIVGVIMLFEHFAEM